MLILQGTEKSADGRHAHKKIQVIRFVRLEALNWCKTAFPIGLGFGIVITWDLCAALRFLVGGEFAGIPIFVISPIGIISGIVVVLLLFCLLPILRPNGRLKYLP